MNKYTATWYQYDPAANQWYRYSETFDTVEKASARLEQAYKNAGYSMEYIHGAVIEEEPAP